LRSEIERVLASLLASSERTKEVTLDAIGDAIGVMAISSDEVDALMTALETRGRRVLGPEGGGGEARLREVLTAARALAGELGRTPNVLEIARRSGLAIADVRAALSLARVMQR
jgi:hypothetical protein